MLLLKKITTILLLTSMASYIGAQCATWVGSPDQEDAENAHSIYRQAMKTKDYDIAFENWEQAYKLAPAADGKRDYHFTDGAAIYLDKFKNETDEAKKKEYKERAIALWDEAIACYEAGTISLKSCGDDKDCYQRKMGYLQGRKAFDMYYTFNSLYSQTLAALKASVAKGGNSTEYIVFDPYASIVVYNFGKGDMTKEEARAAYEELNAIADYNVENNKDFTTYYQQAKDAMNAKFQTIESEIFDCEFFIEKLQPDYEANPDDIETIKVVYATLKKQDCDPNNPFLKELDAKWSKYVAVENSKRQAEFEANNPGVAAKKLYDAGDYAGALSKYDQAISDEADPAKQASYLFSKASIQFRKLKQYSAARASARKAAKLKPNWGNPFMLIGDMYATGARSCGDAWTQRLAVLAAIDKYSYAKSIDASVTDDANKSIGRFRSSMPSLEDGFSRGIKEGQSVKVDCWIGETVKVRYGK